MNRKVSIIVPCYKQGEYLSETLDSVYAQTYSNWECVIVNDGSPDNTEEIAKTYCEKDSRFKYLYQDHSGVSAARNTGISNSNGYYILPLDADDLIGPDYLKLAVDYFTNNPLCKVVYCRVRLFGAINCEWDLGQYSYDTLLWNNCLFSSAIFKRQDYLSTPGYNTNMNFGWEDWDFWLSLLKRGDIVYQLDCVMFFYRIKQSSRNIGANDYKSFLYKQLMNNHKDVYDDIRNSGLEFYAHSKFLERDIEDILHSTTYRIGSLITFPLRKIKQLIKSSN